MSGWQVVTGSRAYKQARESESEEYLLVIQPTPPPVSQTQRVVANNAFAAAVGIWVEARETLNNNLLHTFPFSLSLSFYIFLSYTNTLTNMNAENRWIVVLIGRRRHRRQRSAKLAECVEERERER